MPPRKPRNYPHAAPKEPSAQDRIMFRQMLTEASVPIMMLHDVLTYMSQNDATRNVTADFIEYLREVNPNPNADVIPEDIVRENLSNMHNMVDYMLNTLREAL